jgi:formylglycine-generating enzyme required for sulfatase activity
VGEVDLDVLCERIASGDPPRRLPRRRQRGVSSQAVVVLDRNSRLVPFWEDQDGVVRRIESLAGCVEVRVLPDGIDGPFLRGGWPHAPGLGDVEPGQPLLVLSDLGFYGGPAERASWRRLGRELRRAGVVPRALVPCPPGRWRPELARLWGARPWEPPPSIASRPLESQESCRERLLTLVSIAVRVEPGLLRAVRRLLAPWEADAGTEADVWREASAAHSGAAEFQSEKRQERRAAFHRLGHEEADEEVKQRGREIKQRVVGFLRAWREHVGRDVLHEELAALAAEDTRNECVLSDAETERAREYLRQLAGAARSGAFGRETERAVRGWVLRFEARAPAALRKDPEVGAALTDLALWAEGKTPDSRPESGPFPAGRDLRTLAVPPGSKEGLLEVRHVEGGLSIVPFDPSADRRTKLLGSPVALLGRLRPYVVLERDGKATLLDLDRASEPSFSLPEAAHVLLRSDRAELRLGRFNRPSWAVACGRDRFGLWAEFEVCGVRQRMRWIPPGRFLMGSPKDEDERRDVEGPQHEVTLTRGFWLGETPCTQALWEAVRGENPSRFKGARRPVENVSWDDCAGFFERLNSRAPDLDLRLPTEAEWEYACRAGTTSSRYDEDLDAIAWYDKNSRNETHEVGGKRPNEWGLHDMLGNVWECCADGLREYTAGPATDPVGPAGPWRVCRGGSWYDLARYARAAYRLVWLELHVRFASLGFRLARGQGRSSEKASGDAPGGRSAVRGTRRRRPPWRGPEGGR